MRQFDMSAVLVGIVSLSMACTGSIAGGPDDTGGPGTGPMGTGPTGTGGSASPAVADPNAAGPLPMQRLTNAEYNNTVRDLLGDTTQPASQFATDRNFTFEFRRAGDVAVQDAKLFRTAAETLASVAARIVPGMLLPCDPATGEDACAQKFITTFGLRAFRRPVTTDEAMRLTKLYSTGRTTLSLGFTDTIGLLIEAMLQTPQFLYHWEAAPTEALIKDKGTVVRLGGYQVASRLSYFVWGSMPDDMLLAAAGAGQLDTLEGVKTAAHRLLGDPKAKDSVARFFADWLALDDLGTRIKDPAAYPRFNDALQQAMLNETNAFVQNVAFSGDGLLATFLTAPYSFVNNAVAPIYGASVAGMALQRTDLNPAQRAGLLTQASFLALTGSPTGSNPVLRGKAVYTKLLCNVLPPPPANVPDPKPATAGGTTRQRFVEHDQNSCAIACHTAMDPIGFAFENYDGIGQYRTTDNGLPVDATGSLNLDGRMQKFDNAVGLVDLLSRSTDVRNCFATEWSRFALARLDTDADAPSLQSVAKAFNSGSVKIQDLMASIATMRSFRFRSLSQGETP